MKAIEFETQIEKGIIKVPSRYKNFDNNRVKIIVLAEGQNTTQLNATKITEKDFFEICGICEGRDITKESLRSESWRVL